MAEFHFVEDYEKFVKNLIDQYPIDEAMEIAVGGSYEKVGIIECDILRHIGLTDGVTLVDFGCGSGRLAVQLSKNFDIDYIGFDVVQALLDYAGTRCPAQYRFTLNRNLSFPLEAETVDWVSAFSVFTHLLHTESFIYLEEIFKSLRPGGRLVASFLEFTNLAHWEVFKITVDHQKNSTTPHLNTFTERNAWQFWADRIGFKKVEFIDGMAAPWPSGDVLGQSIVILTKDNT